MGRGRVDFDRGIARLSSYSRAYGHANPKADEEWLSWRVGLWVSKLRANFRSGKLTNEQIVAAREIGVRLSPPYRESKSKPKALTRAQRREGEMLSRLAQLEDFYERHGHINVLQVKGVGSWPGAGRWIARIRGLYRQGSLPETVVRKAEEMGIVWNPGPGHRAGWGDSTAAGSANP